MTPKNELAFTASAIDFNLPRSTDAVHRFAMAAVRTALKEEIGSEIHSLGTIANTSMALLRYLGIVYQTVHWLSRGKNYFADHQLMDRLYNEVVEEVDKLAETTIGVFGGAWYNLSEQIGVMATVDKVFKTAYGDSEMSVEWADEPALEYVNFVNSKFLAALVMFVQRIKQEEQGANEGLRMGLDNLLRSMTEKHTSHAYLLKRRLLHPEKGG
jgi:hypothetical protein